MNVWKALTPLLAMAVLSAIGMVLAAVLSSFLRSRLPSRSYSQPWPLQTHKPLTNPEQVLYFRLTEALPDAIVLAQVQLQSFIHVRRGAADRGLRNHFDRLSVDFLICRPDASITAAVELDDASHDHPKQRERDARKNHALASAGVPLIRWTPRTMPNGDEIRQRVREAASSSGEKSRRGSAAVVSPPRITS